MTTRSVAQGRAVTGWVRNEPDGSVMLEVQGETDEVGAFLVGVRERLSMRITREVEVESSVIEGESAFVIRS